jgi:hypothetical protein
MDERRGAPPNELCEGSPDVSGIAEQAFGLSKKTALPKDFAPARSFSRARDCVSDPCATFGYVRFSDILNLIFDDFVSD